MSASPGRVAQAKGALQARRYTARGPAGASAQFRHTFKADGPNRILSTVMRKTADGWEANFPGSDRLVMTRRTAS